MSKPGFFWNDKKSTLPLIIEQRFKEIQRHEFQADYDRRKIQKMNEIIGSQVYVYIP